MYKRLMLMAPLCCGMAGTAQTLPSGQEVIRAEQVKTIDGGNKVFTGDVQIQMLSHELPEMPVTSAYVIFQPGARSYWHTHPTGQVLMIVEGEGRSGVFGEKVSVLKKGDIVICPKGVKHFHGAAPDKGMIQMTITGNDPLGKNVEWMEEVTDEQYMNTEDK